MLCRGCICTIYDRINEVTNHPLPFTGEGKKKRIMTLKCKTCIYRKKDMKKFLFYCKKKHIRVGERRKSCELYEPK